MQNPSSNLGISLKVYSGPGFTSNITESTVLAGYVITTEPQLKPDRTLYKSRIRTGLTPRIERRGLSQDFQTTDLEASSKSPNKDYKSHTGLLLSQGMHIRKLSAGPKGETGEKLKKSLKKSKENESKTPVKENLDSANNPQTPFRDSFLIIQKSKLAMIEIQVRQKRECKSSFKRQEIPEKIIREVTKLKRKNFQTVEKASLRDAIREKDWISKAKPQIYKSFFSYLNKSSGIMVELPTENFFYYKYFLGKGNNSNLIKQCLSGRWWWTRVAEDEIESAHLIWTQWKDKQVVESLPRLAPTLEVENRLSVSITTSVRFVEPLSTARPKLVDISSLGYNLITRSKSFISLKQSAYKSAEMKIYNKIEHNFHLSNKKALFYNLKSYYDASGEDVFNVIPVTFHLKCSEDPIFQEFETCFRRYEELTDENQRKPANLWIVKPGENSNRGNGISVCSTLDQIKIELKSSQKSGHTYIIQKYIEKPFLVNKRKFDIRCFALVTCINGVLQGYFYSEGYLRTASKPFSLSATNKFIHLTNDAVQKYSEDYGKFENGNKMSYNEFQRYLDNHYERKVSFVDEVVVEIKNIVKKTIESVYFKLDPNSRGHSFEVFGYDFLLDCELKPWLLEVNTNPCLELSSPHLARIIPNMIENALRIAIDPVFQEPPSHSKHYACPAPCDIPENKFELIFHSVTDGETISEKFRTVSGQFEIDELSKEDEDMVGSDSEEM
jgi:tubulin polyglutamylase TTLL1/tubulin monoglycylase TTLL3/8